jgi:hypothetical protein
MARHDPVGGSVPAAGVPSTPKEDRMPSFGDYKSEKWKWITAFDASYYPDNFEAAREHYKPSIDRFRELATEAKDTASLFRTIQKKGTVKGQGQRIQVLRIFRRYASPATSVEMLKKVKDTDEICTAFGPLFRNIDLVRANIGRVDYDPILAALLYEHKDRGIKGYELTDRFFEWFGGKFDSPPYELLGPRRAGKDVQMSKLFPEYKKKCPIDLVVKREGVTVMVGFARYDSDRGGSQEDDRTGGNETKVVRVQEFAKKENHNIKIFFLNDGPGLLLGSMWQDYADLEQLDPSRLMVCTLKMLTSRFTEEWLLST